MAVEIAEITHRGRDDRGVEARLVLGDEGPVVLPGRVERALKFGGVMVAGLAVECRGRECKDVVDVPVGGDGEDVLGHWSLQWLRHIDDSIAVLKASGTNLSIKSLLFPPTSLV